MIMVCYLLVPSVEYKGGIKMANFFIRNTATGSEYWDNVNKKIIHVPNGEEPSFEVESDHSNII